jgi:hypothetical protein
VSKIHLARPLVSLKVPLVDPVQAPPNMVRGRLPSVHESWVQFRDAEIERLAKHLDNATVHQLAEACGFAGALYHAGKANPISFAAIRQHLLRVSEVSDQLSSALDLGSRHAMTLVSLLEQECQSDHGMTNAIELSRLLKALSVGCSRHAKQYVGQTRRRTPEYQVRCIARVLEPKGIKTSAAPGSRFMRIVRICFEAMGIHVDPGRAVRSYLEHRDDESIAM